MVNVLLFTVVSAGLTEEMVLRFYSQFQGEVVVGIEACGSTNWFEELME